MPRITIHLDDATQALVEQAAKARGLSKSRWVAGIIRKHAAHEWPQDCLALAGRFADFPLRDVDDPSSVFADVPRLGGVLVLGRNTSSGDFRGDSAVVPKLMRGDHPESDF